MKLHDTEKLTGLGDAPRLAYRRAVPGGWLYVEMATATFVPDPTAEHVLAAAKTEGDRG